MSKFIKNSELTKLDGIGGKAKNLLKLEALAINIPKWGVIHESVFLEQIEPETRSYNFSRGTEDLIVPEDVLNEIALFFGDNFLLKQYAVRSSVGDEDGEEYSFAGLFETYLQVPPEGLQDAIVKVWKSTRTERVVKYREQNNLDLTINLGVIVQEMICPDVSGVAFGIDPVTGDKERKIITSVYGLGEGIVSGEFDADTFELEKDVNREHLAKKTHKIVKCANGIGVEKVTIDKHLQDVSTLNNTQLNEISDILDKLQKEFQSPQDIEFSYCGDELLLLQSRAVTAIASSHKGEYTLWDNSNIIESYPGVTTPLTFSFIIKMYEMVYRQFVGLMGLKEKEKDKHKEIFANTLGFIRGRVYYNLLNWYKMLAMVPGYSINARFMETMMGVKERFDLKEDYRMSKRIARLRIVSMIFRVIWLHVRLRGERKRFRRHLSKVMSEYNVLDFDQMSASHIVAYYVRYERSLLLEWKAPMINDFFAMIWFGVLKNQAEKICPDEQNIHNDLLCGSKDILSVEPVHRCIKLSKTITEIPECKELFLNSSEQEILNRLENGKFPEVKELIDSYIEKFGDRCVGELKLETISHAHDPKLFIKIIKSYVKQGITILKEDNSIEEKLRKEAEMKIAIALKGKPLKKWWFGYTLRKTRDLVSNRENLRYERTRGFGMVRKMFIALGKRLKLDGSIDSPRDVFYLELDEIKSLEHQEFDLGYKQNIHKRKIEFDTYRKQSNPEERFYTYGSNFSDEYIYSKEKIEPIEGDLKGIGCCPGKVQAKVRLIMDPNEVDSLNGDILVTSSTDPGWVTLFPSASAIIVERGSLLSHSAIVSREMGIPCIVSVTGLLRTLRTGDEVLMDGSTGEIKILNQ